MRKLVHDIAISLGSVAHCTELVRTKQHPFPIELSVAEPDWTPDRILFELRAWRTRLKDANFLKYNNLG